MGKSTGNTEMPQEQSTVNSLTALAGQQIQNAQNLYNQSAPGLTKAQDFYSTLASGDPYAISRAIAPAAQQIDTASAAAKANILQNGPAGGEKNLALEQVDVNRGAKVGDIASQGYLNSFNSLAQLSQQGLSDSAAQSGQGISAYGTALSGMSNISNQQIAQKGAQLGAMSSLGGDAASLIPYAGGAISSAIHSFGNKPQTQGSSDPLGTNVVSPQMPDLSSLPSMGGFSMPQFDPSQLSVQGPIPYNMDYSSLVPQQ